MYENALMAATLQRLRLAAPRNKSRFRHPVSISFSVPERAGNVGRRHSQPALAHSGILRLLANLKVGDLRESDVQTRSELNIAARRRPRSQADDPSLYPLVFDGPRRTHLRESRCWKLSGFAAHNNMVLEFSHDRFARTLTDTISRSGG